MEKDLKRYHVDKNDEFDKIYDFTDKKLSSSILGCLNGNHQTDIEMENTSRKDDELYWQSTPEKAILNQTSSTRKVNEFS